MWLDAAGFRGHIAAVTEEDVEPAETQHETGKQRPEIRWGVVASVVAHIPIIALLIFGLPKIEPKPVEDESVKVELIPPPEEKKPEPKEKPPEPKPPEEAKKEPPPPPPPPPKAAKLPEALVAPQPQRVARPVFEFAEKDSAPEQSERGMPQQAEAPKPPVVEAKPEETSPVELPQPQKPEVPETMPVANPLPQDIELPSVETAEVNPEKNGPAAVGEDEATTNFEQAARPKETVAASPGEEAGVKKSEALTKAKTLYSENATADPMIKTAINNLPRNARINALCQTELQQQLIHAPARYNPGLLPSFPRGISGNILSGTGGAFQNLGSWYDVTLICEVDGDARKVISFRFEVGDKIPKVSGKAGAF
ncbi:DUF930 domain-containing protein [Rhizobium ruizarguesonis]|nr:DUF930 domain-containing protein [Rhizobium ruizarguesonis]